MPRAPLLLLLGRRLAPHAHGGSIGWRGSANHASPLVARSSSGSIELPAPHAKRSNRDERSIAVLICHDFRASLPTNTVKYLPQKHDSGQSSWAVTSRKRAMSKRLPRRLCAHHGLQLCLLASSIGGCSRSAIQRRDIPQLCYESCSFSEECDLLSSDSTVELCIDECQVEYKDLLKSCIERLELFQCISDLSCSEYDEYVDGVSSSGTDYPCEEIARQSSEC